MGRFDPKYSDEQRAAVKRALTEDGMKPREVVQAAANGQLDGLPPFDLNPRTASSWKAVANRRGRALDWQRRAAGTPEEQFDAHAELALQMVAEDLGKLKAKRNRDPADYEAMRKLMQVDREARALLRAIPTVKGGGGRKAAHEREAAPTNPKPTERSEVAGMLAKLSDSEQKTGHNGNESGRVLSHAA